MKRFIRITSDFLIHPLTNNIIFFVFSFILLFIPAFVRDCLDVRYWLMAIPVSITWAYLFSFIIEHIKSIILKIFLYVIPALVTITEVFIITSFGTRFSALIIRLLFETNPNEALGFFSQYVIPSLFWIIICVGLFSVLVYVLEKCSKSQATNHQNMYVRCFVSVSLIFFAFDNGIQKY